MKKILLALGFIGTLGLAAFSIPAVAQMDHDMGSMAK